MTNRVGRSVSWTILGKLCALCAGVYFLVDLLACRHTTLDSARLIYSRPLRRTIFIPVADITDAYPTDWQRSFSVNSGPAYGVLIGTSTRRKPFRIPCKDPDYLCSLLLQLSCSVTQTSAHPAAILQPRASPEDDLVKVHVTLRGFITAMCFTIIGSIAAPVGLGYLIPKSTIGSALFTGFIAAMFIIGLWEVHCFRLIVHAGHLPISPSPHLPISQRRRSLCIDLATVESA